MPTTTAAEKEMIQTALTIIVSDMAGMSFCTGLLFSSGVKAELFFATITELPPLIMDRATADFTKPGLHLLGFEGKGMSFSSLTRSFQGANFVT